MPRGALPREGQLAQPADRAAGAAHGKRTHAAVEGPELEATTRAEAVAPTSEPRPKPAPTPKPKSPPTEPPRSSGWKPSVTDRARRELLRDASSSNVQIAKQLCCTHGHVAEIRRAMIVAGELPAPGPTTYERVLEAVRADPAVNPSELAEMLGVSRNTVHGAIHRARTASQLEAALPGGPGRAELAAGQAVQVQPAAVLKARRRLREAS